MRERLRSCPPLQPALRSAVEQVLHGSAKAGPIFHLAGNRSLAGFGCNPGIENKSIGEFDGLWHGVMVAKCYRNFNLPLPVQLPCSSLLRPRFRWHESTHAVINDKLSVMLPGMLHKAPSSLDRKSTR